MIKKLISSGQPGVERAALDVAIKLDIPYGGWIAKGRWTSDGVLSTAYVLQETTSPDIGESIEKNVRDSDGSFILIRGMSPEPIKFIIDLVERHNRPYLIIDLTEIPAFKAATMLNAWIKNHDIEILHVTGSRTEDDSKIYHYGFNILESMMYLGLVGEGPAGFFRTPRTRSKSTIESKAPHDVDQAVDRLIRELPLREKTIMANLTFGELDPLQKTLGRYIREKFELTIGNPGLTASCSFVNKKAIQNENEAARVIIEKLWEKLRKTHKLRIIK
jgi:hypothetical protein